MIFNILVLSSVLAAAVASRVSYSGSTVLRCRPGDRQQLDYLHNLEEENDMNLDFWLEARNLNKPVDIMVSGQHLSALERMLVGQGIDCTTMLKDVEGRIKGEERHVRTTGAAYSESYHDWQEVHAYIEDLVIMHSDSYAQLRDIMLLFHSRRLSFPTSLLCPPLVTLTTESPKRSSLCPRTPAPRNLLSGLMEVFTQGAVIAICIIFTHLKLSLG